MRFIQATLFNLLLLFAIVTQADEIDAWLDKMTQAMKQQNYEGTLIVRQHDKMQAMLVQHGVGNQEPWESLESLSG